MRRVRVFAPATVANLGPGFDHLGLAVTKLGDLVEAELTDTGRVMLRQITGLTSGIPTDPLQNTATLGAIAALRILGSSAGVDISLHKGLPLGSGLGGSAASAVAAAWAVCVLHGRPDRELAFRAALEAEAQISGAHADNVAPCTFGGMVLVNEDASRWHRVPVPRQLRLVLAVPDLNVVTREARKILPQQVTLAASTANSARLAAMISAAYRGSVRDFALAIKDEIVEPVRAHLIPGFYSVKNAALSAGALACSISGAGPTMFAIVDEPSAGMRVADSMRRAFAEANIRATAIVVGVDRRGVRTLVGRSAMLKPLRTANAPETADQMFTAPFQDQKR